MAKQNERGEGKRTVSPTIRAELLLVKAYHAGIDVHDFCWAFATGRFDTDTEWSIMEYLDANALGDAYYLVGTAKNHGYQKWLGEDIDTIRSKGWLASGLENLIDAILNRPCVARWAKRIQHQGG